jgi:effector-binding domain-containing protein
MEIKEVKPINFLFFRARSTVDNLVEFLPVGQRLFAEAVKMQLPITGPVHWHYHGFVGNPNEPFDLEVALPVGGLPSEYDGTFHIKRTQTFKCVVASHEGAWSQIPETYRAINEFVRANKLKPSSVNREIYINVDFVDPLANKTEIQFGII